MGEIQSIQENQSYKSNLNLIESTQDRNFGFIDIYRTKEPPYQYVMDFKKNFIEDNEKMKKYLNLVNQVKNMDHKNLAKIHYSELVEQNQVCIKHKKIHTFYHYYNFTLEGAIEKKKMQNSVFQEPELIYIMSSLLQVASYLQKYGISIGQYRTKTIYLSPQGYIKLYLLQIQQQNKHHCYFKVLSERSQLQNYILSPEQLYYLNQLEYSIKYDIYKSDLFAIAMIILELITLDKSKFYYNQTKTQLKIDRISFDISSVGKNYSQRFINLLKNCLQLQPSTRWSLMQALQEVNSIKKSMKNLLYCIRLQDEDEKTKRNAKRQIKMSIKGQHILNGLQKKLTPSPITTLSSSVSTNFRIQTKSLSGRNSQL